jgi:predicted nucleic acid-binding protein
VNACFVDPLDEALAKAAGELCGKAKVADVVDAAVVASAARRGDAILTGDPRDLRRLAPHAPGIEIIKL